MEDTKPFSLSNLVVNTRDYKEDLDQYKRIEAWYWGYDDVV